MTWLWRLADSDQDGQVVLHELCSKIQFIAPGCVGLCQSKFSFVLVTRSRCVTCCTTRFVWALRQLQIEADRAGLSLVSLFTHVIGNDARMQWLLGSSGPSRPKKKSHTCADLRVTSINRKRYTLSYSRASSRTGLRSTSWFCVAQSDFAISCSLCFIFLPLLHREQ